MRLLKCISRPMTLFGFGLLRVSSSFVLVASFIFVCLASSPVFAADYLWTVNSNGRFTSSSPEGACAAANFSNENVTYAGAVFVTAAQYNCTVTNNKSGTTTVVAQAVRTGSSCASGSTLDPVKGTCNPDNKCAILKDTAIPKFRWDSATDTPGDTISINGCAAKISGVTICKNTTAGQYSCTGTATITGDKTDPSKGPDGKDCTGTACTDGEPQKQTTDNPCSAIPAGSGFTCTSTKTDSTPGTTQCGTANGAWVCVENPKSASNTSKSTTTQTSTKNADGSTSTNTTVVTDTTSCKGVGNCSSGTTTTVTSGGTNSNGTSKPNSSTCTGPECGGGKVGSGTGNGNGNNGNGQGGEGDGDDDEDKDKGFVSGDMTCPAVVTCTGDVIQCAILRQEQQSRCADLKFRDLSDGPVNDAKASLTSEFAGKDYQPITAQGDDVHDISSLIKTDKIFSSSCPVLPSISIPFGQFKTELDFNLSGFCDFLTFLGFLNVAFALRKAAEIVGQGV